jgi:hypothetical protein
MFTVECTIAIMKLLRVISLVLQASDSETKRLCLRC